MSELTREHPCLNLQLDVCLMQCLLCGLLGLCLSSLLCTPLLFDYRVGNIAGAGLDCLMGHVLLVVQVVLCYCCCLCHDGAMGIAGIIVCLRFCDLYCH